MLSLNLPNYLILRGYNSRPIDSVGFALRRDLLFLCLLRRRLGNRHRLRALFCGVVRRILVAAQRFAGELDQVMADERHAERPVDLTLLERVPGGAPIGATVVGLDADMPDHAP